MVVATVGVSVVAFAPVAILGVATFTAVFLVALTVIRNRSFDVLVLAPGDVHRVRETTDGVHIEHIDGEHVVARLQAACQRVGLNQQEVQCRLVGADELSVHRGVVGIVRSDQQRALDIVCRRGQLEAAGELDEG